MSKINKWRGTWKQNNANARGPFELEVKRDRRGNRIATYILNGRRYEGVTTNHGAKVITLAIRPYKACREAILQFNFANGSPVAGEYRVDGKSAYCKRSGVFTF